jgi:AraC-like DNA-binding protein
MSSLHEIETRWHNDAEDGPVDPMAGRANSLTKDARRTGARESRSAPSAAPTIPATDFQVLARGLRDLGYDVPALLAESGITEHDLANPDARLPCEAYGALICQAMRVRYTPNISLKLAQATEIGSYPLLDYLVLTSDTVASGLRQLAHYVKLTGSPVQITLRESGESTIAELTCAPPAAMAVEYSASLMVLDFRRETGGQFSAERVSFRHTPDDVSEFERVLKCPVHANAPLDSVVIGADALRLLLTRRDPVLRGVLERQANEILAKLPKRGGLAADVQRVLADRVAGRTGGDLRVDAVARDLTTSGRTLQRRLSAEGVSYQELLDEARKEAAGRYLGESVFAIGEVAYLVGYSEPAPFYRAFKRWYGVTPEAYRQAQRGEEQL